MMDITLAIADKLASIVPSATIYREHQEQAFDEPSFYVYEIMADSKANLMDYQTRKHLYCVMWFPDSKKDNMGIREQCEIMRSKLLDEFDMIDSLSLKLLDKEAKIESDALHFTFKLRYRVQKEQPRNEMKQLSQNGGIKHG
ncbi:hypothetical protein QLI93_001605 [Listeria monocytogenes]|nr:hypothetical protein [Listeria monocytogenes]EKZ7015248.1 hypothetical protein [Listeria monocytogenes]